MGRFTAVNDETRANACIRGQCRHRDSGSSRLFVLSCENLPLRCRCSYSSPDPGAAFCSRRCALGLVFQHETRGVAPTRSGLADSSAIFWAASRSQAGTSTAMPEAWATIDPSELLSQTTITAILNSGIGASRLTWVETSPAATLLRSWAARHLRSIDALLHGTK